MQGVSSGETSVHGVPAHGKLLVSMIVVDVISSLVICIHVHEFVRFIIQLDS